MAKDKPGNEERGTEITKREMGKGLCFIPTALGVRRRGEEHSRGCTITTAGRLGLGSTLQKFTFNPVNSC